MHVRLCRRSDLSPRRMIGVVGQKWRTSGYHLARSESLPNEAWSDAYLFHDILERVGAIDGEANEEEISFWVGEWSKTVVFFLASCVPECQLDCLATWPMGFRGDIILEYGRNVFLFMRLAIRSLQYVASRTSGK